MLNEIKTNKKLILAMAVGLVLRVLFLLIGAKYYFGRDNIFIDGDTGTWASSIQNLIEHGVYSLNLNHEYGYFGRTPGYSFFIGIFYLLTGKDWNAAYPIIAWTQLLFDVFAIYIVYKIGLKLFNGDKKSAVIPTFLYSTYPFIIVWNPVVYSESLSIFFLIIGFYYFIYEEKKCNFFLAGTFLSLSAQCRPQILLIIPLMGIVILFQNRKNIPVLFKKSIQFGIAVLIFYGSWPIRNYVNYGKIELTHDLRGFEVWNIDAIAFREYIYSVKAEWEPQFSQILRNEKVIFPKEAYPTKDDSMKLEKVIKLSKNCGSGFSNWRGYWKEPVKGENCNNEIKRLFDELRLNQAKDNPFNYYFIIPIKNLQKAIFKSRLYDTKSFGRKFASLLFNYRTLLIVLGIIGTYVFLKENNKIRYFAWVSIVYFMLLYLLICGGTGPDFRNIEMRYFLPADILLLIMASVSLKNIIEKYRKLVRT